MAGWCGEIEEGEGEVFVGVNLRGFCTETFGVGAVFVIFKGAFFWALTIFLGVLAIYKYKKKKRV